MTEPSPLSRSLTGLRVLDLTRNLAGPFCTMLLADLGADVVKVEKPGIGDDTRAWQPPAWNGHSATFLAANRNKRSLAIDLDHQRGREIIGTLAREADVLVESFRPGSLDKRGLGYEQLRESNPALIYCSISAYGSTGPKAHLPGYDPVLQADTGIMSLTGYPDAPPARVGIGAIDLGTALWATIGIQAALGSRRETGQGAWIQTSLFETSAWWLSHQMAGYLATGTTPSRHGTGQPFIAPYELFATADEDLFIAAANDALFRTLVGELGLTGLHTDPRFAGNTDRVVHRIALRAVLQPPLLERGADEWEGLLRKAGVPCSRVRTVADLAVDPQLEALGLLTELPHPDIPGLRLVDVPFRLNDARASHRFAPPLLGQHTDDVLRELGLGDADLAGLRAGGVIG